MSSFNAPHLAHTIWVIRHSDRFDHDIGSDEWEAIADVSHARDPPLSDIGLRMAMETADSLYDICKSNSSYPTKVITSPFLRCIQTANPIAGKLGSPLCLDNSLYEIIYTDEVLPSAKERFRYFPRIDVDYEPLFFPEVNEQYPDEALTRYHSAALGLAARFPNEGIVLVTHAAGVVAILASLLNCRIRDVPAASPCGLFRLDLTPGSEKYTLADNVNGITSHISKSGKTTAWPTSSDTWEGTMKFLEAGDQPSWLH
jgi:broad specificity phosphatase PhoE